MYRAIYEISPLEKATALVSFFQNVFFAAPTIVAANMRARKFNQLPLGNAASHNEIQCLLSR